MGEFVGDGRCAVCGGTGKQSLFPDDCTRCGGTGLCRGCGGKGTVDVRRAASDAPGVEPGDRS